MEHKQAVIVAFLPMARCWPGLCHRKRRWRLRTAPSQGVWVGTCIEVTKVVFIQRTSSLMIDHKQTWPLGCPKKNQKSEFWNVTYPIGFHRLDEPPEKISAL